jgi:hypothetical protein
MSIDAVAAVGTGQPDDYVLSPVAHSEELRATAPRLAALLTHSHPLEQLARQFEEADTEALSAQRESRTWVSRANWAILVTAAVSALLMAVGLLDTALGAATRLLLWSAS